MKADHQQRFQGHDGTAAGKASDADRRLRQADRLARVLRVLQLIQGRGCYDAAAIARELEVSERTVYRDLAVLELAGVPWLFDKTRQGYTVRPDFQFPTLNLTEDEILGQATATVLTQAAGLDVSPGARPTTEKLAATSDKAGRILREAQELIEVLDLKLADHRQHREFIRTVQWALLKRKQLIGLYASPYEPQPVKLTLHPYRLALVKACWYVIGRPADADQPRTFRVTRFKSLRMLDEPAQVPEDFDLRAYFGNAWAVYRGEKSYGVELLFTKDAADVVTETTWHHTQQVRRHEDGTVTLTYRVDGLNEIVRWVLGWARRVKVVHPKELRERVIAQHRLAIEMQLGDR
jgi:predicted DNA-binding transcriptional regulator YafY